MRGGCKLPLTIAIIAICLTVIKANQFLEEIEQLRNLALGCYNVTREEL